jgi:hypothetical protein
VNAETAKVTGSHLPPPPASRSSRCRRRCRAPSGVPKFVTEESGQAGTDLEPGGSPASCDHVAVAFTIAEIDGRRQPGLVIEAGTGRRWTEAGDRRALGERPRALRQLASNSLSHSSSPTVIYVDRQVPARVTRRTKELTVAIGLRTAIYPMTGPDSAGVKAARRRPARTAGPG